jgi:hypothetical protein
MKTNHDGVKKDEDVAEKIPNSDNGEESSS